MLTGYAKPPPFDIFKIHFWKDEKEIYTKLYLDKSSSDPWFLRGKPSTHIYLTNVIVCLKFNTKIHVYFIL